MKPGIKMIGLTATACILFVIGCYNKRIVWSPDGKWGAICPNSGLYFTDPEGNVTKKMHDHVYRAAWFPDSRHLAIEEYADITDWESLKTIVPLEQQKKFIQYAQSLLLARNQMEWEAKIKTLLDLNLLSEDELTAVKLYIRDKQAGPFPDSVIASWQPNLTFHYHFLRIGLWDGKQFTIKKTLWNSSERIWDMQISSKGRVVTFTTAYPDLDDDEELNVSSLWAADLQTGRSVLLDQNVALYPGWSADGQSLFYVRSIGEGKAGNAIGTLLQIQPCDSAGALLEQIPQPKGLAGLVAGEYTKVRCLSDGRIIFSSIELTLPIIGKDIPEYKQLFVLDPTRQATITRLIPHSTLDQTRSFNLDFFEVSPDETMISLLDDDGRVAVLTVATGDFILLQGEKLGPEIVVPVWRTPNELCYLGPTDGKTGLFSKMTYKQVFLQGPDDEGNWGQARVISKNWPEEVKQDWLENK